MSQSNIRYIRFNPNNCPELSSPPLYIEEKLDEAYNIAKEKYGKVTVLNNLNMICCAPHLDESDWVTINNTKIIFYPIGARTQDDVQTISGLLRSDCGDEDFILRYNFDKLPDYLPVPLLGELPIPLEWRKNITPIWFCAYNNPINTICMETFQEVFQEHSNFKPLPIEISIKLEESFQCGYNVVTIENYAYTNRYSVSPRMFPNINIGIKQCNDGTYRYIYRFLITHEQHQSLINELEDDYLLLVNKTNYTEKKCMICDELLKQQPCTKTSCNHIFHTNCIPEWKKIQQSTKCLICRSHTL